MLKNNSNHYGAVSKLLHWLMALLIIALIGVGMYMAELPKDSAAQKAYAFQFYGMHKAMGVVVLLLLFARLAWLRISPAPALPAAFCHRDKVAAKGVQALLYILMLLVPLSGYLMSNAGGHPISFFGLFELPALVDKNEGLGHFTHEAHHIMGILLIPVILVHMAGVIKHRIKDKGGEGDILKRML